MRAAGVAGKVITVSWSHASCASFCKMMEAISVGVATGADDEAVSCDALEGRRKEPRPRRDDLRRIEPNRRATFESFFVSGVAALGLLERTWSDPLAMYAVSCDGKELGCRNSKESSII